MDNFIQVENHPNLYRDTNSNAIINKNVDQLKRFKAERDTRLKAQSKIDQLEKRINNVDEKLDQILKVLKDINK